VPLAATVLCAALAAFQYNGRVFDPGTGFHDYGARLYWPQIGRFISPDTYHGDPSNPASLNLYSYVHNNPYRYTDPTGHWSSKAWPGFDPVHQMTVEKVLGNVGSRGVEIMKGRQDFMDANQSPAGQYEHAMWDDRAGTRAEAIQNANNAVMARLLGARAQAAGSDAFFEELGDAIHTLQDATSPSHRGFQDWHPQSVGKHSDAERRYPAEGSAERAELEGVTRWAGDIATSKADMPGRFFNPDSGRVELPDSYRK
jgi:RHS repeat-associated protein